jgi:hypothetical protein
MNENSSDFRPMDFMKTSVNTEISPTRPTTGGSRGVVQPIAAFRELTLYANTPRKL